MKTLSSISLSVVMMSLMLLCSCSKKTTTSIKYVYFDKPCANLLKTTVLPSESGEPGMMIFGSVDYARQLSSANDDEIIVIGYGYLNDYVKVTSDNHLSFAIPKDMIEENDLDFRSFLISPRCYLFSRANPFSETIQLQHSLFTPSKEIDVNASTLYGATVKSHTSKLSNMRKLNSNVRYLFYLIRVGVYNNLSCYKGYVSDDEIEKLFIKTIPGDFFVRVACPIYN